MVLGQDRKAVASLVCFDVVQAHDREGVRIEKRLRCRKPSFQARCRGGSDSHDVEVELRLEFGGPLLDQVRRTKYGDSINLAAVEQFSDDEASLNGFADTDVVRDH